MKDVNSTYLDKHKKFRTDSKKLATAFIISAFVVAVVVFWWLKLVGITVTGDAFCGVDEHTHGDDCYISELVCGFEENNQSETDTQQASAEAETSATKNEEVLEQTTEVQESTSEEDTTDTSATEAESVQEKATLSQEKEQTAPTHTHSEECYKKTLTCTKAEHTHTPECFPDKTADTETVSDWLETIKDVEITNNIPENLIAVATSQVGYEESSRNFEYDSEGNKNGYTRYGEWYGNPYGDWNTMFVSFCLHYSNINNDSELKCAGAKAMKLAWEERGVYSPAEEHSPERGDIAFIDNDGDGTPDTVAIIIAPGEVGLVTIMGDSNNKVENVSVGISDGIIGYGTTGKLCFAKDMNYTASEQTTAESDNEAASTQKSETTEAGTTTETDENTTENQAPDADPNSSKDTQASVTVTEDKSEETTKSEESAEQTDESGKDIPDEKSVNISSKPLMLYNKSAEGPTIIEVNDITPLLKNAVIKTETGEVLGNDSVVYVGQSYILSLEFSEINTGSTWYQFKHDDDHHLHYQIPSNIHAEAFDEPQPITAKTENGTIENVGTYYINEDGMLIVIFKDDENDQCFASKYSNVDFTIDFTATVGSTQSGSSTEIEFNDKINVNLNLNTDAEMKVTKTAKAYDAINNTKEYTIRIEGTKAVIKDLVVYDDMYTNATADNGQHVLKDTIVVTDLDGNVLDPQPEISDGRGTGNLGFTLTGFPDFAAGEGFLITYKSAINDERLNDESVGLWNGVYPQGKDSTGKDVEGKAEYWERVYLNKIEKNGKQTVLKGPDGKPVPVIEWEVEIRKSDTNLQGTVLIDTLGQGLEYYTGQDIKIIRYDKDGNKINPDSSLSWNNVDINGNSMSFPLPDGYRYVIVYYTTYEDLKDGEQKHYTNTAKVTINQKEEVAGGEADVVGFIPQISKTASGDDGKYVNFTIEAKVPAVIKDWGHFFLTDLSAIWGYKGNSEGYLYVENVPEDLVITATTKDSVIEFSPYVEGGPTENTYILVTPAGGNQHHSFNIYFNTSAADPALSKWILDEDSTLTVSYKIPFDAATGVEWSGELTGDKILEDVLLEKYKLANEVYLNYTDIITATGVASYNYTPKITKKSLVNDDGTFDYTVTFYNTIPGSQGPLGYLYSAQSILFNDTFDEKLEYVPGSFTLTCYSPWSDSTWFAEYKIDSEVDAEITGNTITLNATDLNILTINQSLPEDTISWIKWMPNYQSYCNSIAGGRHVFTYKLRLKDKYLKTTEENIYELDNTAELTWDGDNTSGPVSDEVIFKTGLLDKHAVQENNKLNFDIHINKNALDILEGADTLTIEDTMTHNLSVYWDTIKLYYQDSNGAWIDFDSDSSEYEYSVTYDQLSNKLTFVVPDSLHIRVDYTTLITESGHVSVNNAVKVDGKASVTDIIDATFKVEQHSGGATGSIHNITLIKQDGDTDVRLSDAKFHLYGPMGDPDAVLPDGASKSIVADSGESIYYIGTYTTGADGTVKIETQYLTIGGPYALVETVPPKGYNPLEKPVYFYFYEPDPNGIIQTVTTLIAVENYTYGYVLPETGGMGTLPLAIIGISLMACPILYSTIRRKRERRLT